MDGSCNRASARDRIIHAYLKLLAKGGRKKVTVSAIAKEAGCNRDTFYYHFPSLDEAARYVLDELAPSSVPHIALALASGEASAIPDKAKTRMLLVAKIARNHPHMRLRLEGVLKDLWITELGVDAMALTCSDGVVLDFMASGTVGFICEHLADADGTDAFDKAFCVIARTFGKSALDYAKERGLLPGN